MSSLAKPQRCFPRSPVSYWYAITILFHHPCPCRGPDPAIDLAESAGGRHRRGALLRLLLRAGATYAPGLAHRGVARMCVAMEAVAVQSMEAGAMLHITSPLIGGGPAEQRTMRLAHDVRTTAIISGVRRVVHPFHSGRLS